MFAGVPGTGVGALFFALIALAVALFRRGRGLRGRVLLGALWISGFVFLVFGGLGRGVFGDGAEGPAGLLIALGPLLLLALILGLSALAARRILGRRSARRIEERPSGTAPAAR